MCQGEREEARAASQTEGQIGPLWLGGDGVVVPGHADEVLDTLTTFQNVTVSKETSE